MHIVWGARRKKLNISRDMGLRYTEESDTVDELIRRLTNRQYAFDDTIVICEDRNQVVLLILRAIPANLLPKAIIIVTPDPMNKWLVDRIPDYLREILYLTTNVASVKIRT